MRQCREEKLETNKNNRRRLIMFLPHELIIQILLRLPVKCLIRFKCVCKLWFSLISHDSNFANSHFQLTASKNPIYRILLKSKSARSIDVKAPLDSTTASTFGCIFPDYFADFEVKGSCRGFILFCSFTNFYVWNPSTGVQKEIPLSPFSSNLDAQYLYGFGYDDSTQDYLVVSLSNHVSDDPPLHLEYFSLKANIWKEVEGPHFPYIFPYENGRKGGSLLKGAIHWLAFRSDLQCDLILAFDLKERKLSYMDFPSGGIWDRWGLLLHGEFLSLYGRNDDIIEIWVMKEYKVNSSWTIMALVLPVDSPYSLHGGGDFRPLCCTKSGDIIGFDEHHFLVKYDKNGQFLEKYSYSSHYPRDEMTIYIDSLLSLPGDGASANEQT